MEQLAATMALSQQQFQQQELQERVPTTTSRASILTLTGRLSRIRDKQKNI